MENNPLKFHTICIDGIDKTGKDTLKPYLWPMSKQKYLTQTRGIISMIAYCKIYGRPYAYDIEQHKYILQVVLTCDLEDWKLRCEITNEPKISYTLHQSIFNEVIEEVKKYCHVLTFNTSEVTPYQIAQEVLAYMEILNSKE